jgi:5-methylthioadenosine/S-adenosylhomocysteine deaminase
MRHFCRAVCLFAFLGIQIRAAETADWIIRAEYVITMDAHHRVIDRGAVAISGTRIVGVGSQDEIARRFEAKHTLDEPQAVVTPGLIDTHTHAPMSLFRAIADDKRLEDWLTNFIFPAESKNASPDFVRWGTRLACLEMVLAGITTYTDMYYFEDIEAETAREAGLRGVLGEAIIGFPAPDHKSWQQSLAATERYIQRFRTDDLVVPAVAPHAIYTTPDEALVASHNLALKYGVPLLIHLSETKTERNDALAKRHMTPTRTLETLRVLDGRVIAAHCIWEDDEDLRILRRHGTGVAHCPSSNTKLASGIAPITAMLKMGLNVGLGNDGFAGSNDTADLIAEMSLASKLQKVTAMDPRVLPAEQVMEMATSGGARVLGLDKEIGSIEQGKRADVITISLHKPNAVPLYNLYSQIVYASKAADVQDVFINGRQIVSERHVLTLNQEEIYRKAEEYGHGIARTLGTASVP